MQVVSARWCGWAVHKRTVVACVLLSESEGAVRKHVPTFGTMTHDLLALSDWLGGLGVTQVALESTGVYWRPVFNLLEDDERTVVLVNPQHMRAVPGRKTDVKDREWLADPARGMGWCSRALSRHPASSSPGAARADASSQGAGPCHAATR
jgi:transposase